MTPFTRLSFMAFCVLVSLFGISLALFASPVSAAPVQDSIEVYLGDTIDLHGTAYAGSRLYLFMTGPGLPANGVMLTDTTQLASKGNFNIVDVNSDQTWLMKWNTDRIRNQIKPGTYKVYVSTSPSDYASLSGSYKVMTVYLKDPGPRNGVSINAGTYTLNPEAHVYTRTEYPTTATTVSPVITPNLSVTTVPSPDPATPLATQKSDLTLLLPVFSVAAGAIVVLSGRRRKI